MAIAIVALLACEADLTLTAGAIGLGLRRSHPLITATVTLAVALGFVAVAFALWALWFLAPSCAAGAACTAPAGTGGSFAAAAGAQWAWLFGVSMAARRAAARRRLTVASG